jgi:hypothetical protein
VKSLLSAILAVTLLTSPALAQGEDAPSPEAPQAPAVTEPEVSTFQEGFSQLSALQSMLEFYFMEAGVYPAELSELSAVFNYQLPKNSRAVVIPKDPASGQPFVYIPAPNKKGYKLRFPDPSKYGPQGAFELAPVSWGWLALRAERARFEEMAKLSKYHIETLASAAEMYAKDNNRVFPKDLDALYPKYIKRHPQDPITGRNYLYKQLADGYLISNPNPERYGLIRFEYSSSRGMIVEVLPAGSATKPSDAKP